MREKRKFNLYVDTNKNPAESIFSPSEITPDLVLSNFTIDPSLILLYNNLDLIFHSTEVGFSHQYLLRKIARKFSKSASWTYYKSYKVLNEIINLLHLNLLEIAYWSCLLENDIKSYFRPLLSAYFTAYQAKIFTNKDISPYEQQINIKIPNFKYLYCNWQLVCNTPEITVKDINVQYSLLISKKNSRNYEKMMDKIVGCSKKFEKQAGSNFSNIEKMMLELQGFQTDWFKGEKLSPISEI